MVQDGLAKPCRTAIFVAVSVAVIVVTVAVGFEDLHLITCSLVNFGFVSRLGSSLMPYSSPLASPMCTAWYVHFT